MSEQHSGWAEGEHPEPAGPFVLDMDPPGGVLARDMPVERPYIRPRKRIKGLAPPTGGPERGEWKDVT